MGQDVLANSTTISWDESSTGVLKGNVVDDSISNAKLANVATATIKGRVTSGTGDPEDLTATQATTILNAFTGDSGAGGVKGLVPAPSTGDSAAGKSLKASGSWGYAPNADSSGNVYPAITGGALGTTTNMWADAFLESGGVINWNNGDVLITHSSNTLAFSGASSGYTFDALIAPATSDGAPLGSASLMWSDAFFASGAVLNFNNGDVTITHGSNALTITGGVTALDANSTVGGAKIATVGKQTIWVPASAMWARTTNGPATASRELTTGGDIMVKGWAFDATTEEGVQFYIAFPKSWDKGTITFQAYWTNASGLTTETVSWGLSAGAITNSDPLDTTDLGTEVRVSGTWLAQNDLHVTAESAAVTVGNTPIDDDMVICQIVRSVANDNMTGDAELLGIKVFYTTNAATDL